MPRTTITEQNGEDNRDEIAVVAAQVLLDLETFFDDGDEDDVESSDSKYEEWSREPRGMTLDEIRVVVNASIERHHRKLFPQPQKETSRFEEKSEDYMKKPEKYRRSKAMDKMCTIELPFAHYQQLLEQKIHQFNVTKKEEKMMEQQRYGRKLQNDSNLWIWSGSHSAASRSIPSEDSDDNHSIRSYQASLLSSGNNFYKESHHTIYPPHIVPYRSGKQVKAAKNVHQQTTDFRDQSTEIDGALASPPTFAQHTQTSNKSQAPSMQSSGEFEDPTVREIEMEKDPRTPQVVSKVATSKYDFDESLHLRSSQFSPHASSASSQSIHSSASSSNSRNSSSRSQHSQFDRKHLKQSSTPTRTFQEIQIQTEDNILQPTQEATLRLERSPKSSHHPTISAPTSSAQGLCEWQLDLSNFNP